MSILALIEEYKEQGFKVYSPEKLSTYFYVTDGVKIAYVQSGSRGVEFTSVHKPCTHSGTGYACDSVEEAFRYRPHWASYSEPIIKYKDMQEYINKYWQPLIER